VQPDVSAFYTGIPLNAKTCGWPSRPLAAPRKRLRFRARAQTVSCIKPWRPSVVTARIWTQRAKKRLEEIDVELTQVTTKFSENVLDSTNVFELLLTNESRSGRPPTHCGRVPPGRVPSGRAKEGWRFTLQAPDYFRGDDLSR